MTRDYLTMPFWLYLALGYSLARLVYGGQRPTYLLVGIVLTGCAVFSFTRSYAICALGLWALAGFWKVVIVPSQRKTIQPRARVNPVRAWTLIVALGGLGGAVLGPAELAGLLVGLSCHTLWHVKPGASRRSRHSTSSESLS